MSRTSQAMLLMLFSMASFAAMNTVIHMLAGHMHSTQMVFIRNVMSLFIVIGFAAFVQRGVPRFKTTRFKGHFMRAAAGALAMQLWFHAVTMMPITLATAVSFTTPIFATIFAILFLGERAGIRRWSAIFIGFIGMLVILRPDVAGIDLASGVVIAASAMMALSGVLVKNLTKTEGPETIVFYMALFMIPWSTPLAMVYWQPVLPLQWLWLTLIALFSTAAQLMMARAFMRAEMVVLMPLDFTRLLFTALFAFIFFGEMLDAQTIIGSGIIVASTVYIAHREARLKK